MFNFGELLMHPVIKYLKEEWLLKLLTAFNLGQVSQFNALAPQWKQQADLVKKEV